MGTNRDRAPLAVLLMPALALVSCGDGDAVQAGAPAHDVADSETWPSLRLTAHKDTAVLEIGDDEVVFAGVPFDRTVPISPVLLEEATSAPVEIRLGGLDVSIVYDADRDALLIDTGTLRFAVDRDDEELEYQGQRARLGGGAKRAVFPSTGGVQVMDLERTRPR